MPVVIAAAAVFLLIVLWPLVTSIIIWTIAIPVWLLSVIWGMLVAIVQSSILWVPIVVVAGLICWAIDQLKPRKPKALSKATYGRQEEGPTPR